MKQIIQSFRKGEISLTDVPPPALRPRGILVRTACSLISAGTERMVLEFAEKGLIGKARSRPDLVSRVIDKVKKEGVLAAYEGVRSRLDQPLPLGYSSSGVVIEVGAEAVGFKPGDRVACAGGGYACHAEVAYVPRNLAVYLTENVSFESGTFTTLGAIALQGIRQAEVRLGDNVAVIGLGLLGQLTVQMLKAAGCRVFGVDLNPARVAQALQLGADSATTTEIAESSAQEFTGSRGFDSVVITADSRSNDPVYLAGEIARDRAIIVAVGAVGMEIPRKIYYDKELDFRLSRSYGPGRYDPDYEDHGNDYPYSYVRWTEQRNMEAFVRLVESGAVKVEPLITHRFPIDDALDAYELIAGGATGEAYTGVVLAYPFDKPLTSQPSPDPLQSIPSSASLASMRLGVVGAGSFANAVVFPILKRLQGIELVAIASGSGVSAATAKTRFGFSRVAKDSSSIFDAEDINTVAILTRHDAHARQVIAALDAGKNVFVEKPLCLNEEELRSIVEVYYGLAAKTAAPPLVVTVGYNRRFAPFTRQLRSWLDQVSEPLMLTYRVNAGSIPLNHWTQSAALGGGRLLGEGCHFIDLLLYLANSTPQRIYTKTLPNCDRYSGDNFSVTIEFKNGSVGVLTYVANGHKSFRKECIEVFGGGLAARLDDFRTLEIFHGGKRLRRTARLRAEKGHRELWSAFVSSLVQGGTPPIPFNDLVTSALVTLAAYRSTQKGSEIDWYSFMASHLPDGLAANSKA